MKNGERTIPVEATTKHVLVWQAMLCTVCTYQAFCRQYYSIFLLFSFALLWTCYATSYMFSRQPNALPHRQCKAKMCSACTLVWWYDDCWFFVLYIAIEIHTCCVKCEYSSFVTLFLGCFYEFMHEPMKCWYSIQNLFSLCVSLHAGIQHRFQYLCFFNGRDGRFFMRSDNAIVVGILMSRFLFSFQMSVVACWFCVKCDLFCLYWIRERLL